jgi:hypothetical protein
LGSVSGCAVLHGFFVPRGVASGGSSPEGQVSAPWFDNWTDELRRLSTEDGDDEFLRTLLVASTTADADVQALLRLAIDAEQNNRELIETDAAATAAYRRVLDRMGLPFENYAFEAMYE